LASAIFFGPVKGFIGFFHALLEALVALVIGAADGDANTDSLLRTWGLFTAFLAGLLIILALAFIFP
jgi:hypothetical protein